MQAYVWQVMLSTSSRNLKAEECWGEIDISTKGVIDRREEGGGRGREKKNMPARCHCSFGKLRSWANRISDWCGVALIG